MLVLLIDKPIDKEGPIGGKLCGKGIIIAQKIPLKFEGDNKNTFGIGTKTYAYIKDKIIANENYTTRAYLSSVNPNIHIGLGESNIIDSLQIIWPGGVFQTIKNIFSLA